MKVLEMVRKFGLADYTKQYYDGIGRRCDTKYPLPELAEMVVKSVDIDFVNKIAVIYLCKVD